MKQLTDLREILRYVPQFREKAFVISLNGAVVAHENFHNLLLDIALMRSLRIQVALVHGASQQIEQLAEQTGKKPSNTDGSGITDAVTLDLSITASNRISHEILEGLSANDLRGACCNAVVAHPAGILKGVDQLFTGRVERIDAGLLASLLEQDIVPVIPPLGIDGEGHTYRLNSDTVAVEVARALRAVKLIYLAVAPGIRLKGQLLRQLDLPQAQEILKNERSEVHPDDVSKLEQGIRSAQLGVPRTHIIDGSEEQGLLAEVFSNEGIGTLIHANEYQSIRKALKKDVRAIHQLIQAGMESDELMRRTRADIERQIDDFYLFEVDRAPVACVAIHIYPDANKSELACLYVDSRFDNQGIGLKLTQFVDGKVKAAGVLTLFCLSTQAADYFVQKCGYQLGTPDDLPPSRRAQYDRSGRQSRVLVKKL
jgi:amino-acid N-acetyltransferase